MSTDSNSDLTANSLPYYSMTVHNTNPTLPQGARAYLYSRSHPGCSPEVLEEQFAVLRKHCSNQGWEIVEEFKDLCSDGPVYSGQPERDRMLMVALNTPRPADIILVNSPSWLAKTAKEYDGIASRLENLGWKIYATDDFVPPSELGKLFELFIDIHNANFLHSIMAMTKEKMS